MFYVTLVTLVNAPVASGRGTLARSRRLAVQTARLYFFQNSQHADREHVEKRCSNDVCMVEDLKVIDANGGCKRDIRRKRCSGRGIGQIGPPDDPKNALIYERQLGCQIVT